MPLFEPELATFSSVVARLTADLPDTIDTTPGSVVLTLLEAYAREMAVFYGMLELAYESGYLDTAAGAALDNVVAVLGIKRARAGRLAGQVELSRATAAADDIGIPAGRRVTGILADGTQLPIFETVEDAVIPAGGRRVLVAVQEVLDDSASADAQVANINAGSLTVMPRPLLGIEAVTNLAPMSRAGLDETDDQLRARARNALRAQGQGSLDSIAAAVREQGVEDVVVREPAGRPAGIVEVVIGDPNVPDARVKSILKAIRDAKPAGVRVELSYAQSIIIELIFDLEPADPNVDDSGFDRIQASVQQALADYIASLPAGTTVSRRKLEATIFANPDVRRINDIKVTTYTEEANQLQKEAGSRIVGPDRDIRMGPLETPVIDTKRKPLISRLVPPLYRLDLTVVDTRSADVVRRALDVAVVSLADDLFQRNEDTLDFDYVAKWFHDHAGVTRVTAIVVVTTSSAGSVTLAATGDELQMETNWELSLSKVQIVGGP